MLIGSRTVFLSLAGDLAASQPPIALQNKASTFAVNKLLLLSLLSSSTTITFFFKFCSVLFLGCCSSRHNIHTKTELLVSTHSDETLKKRQKSGGCRSPTANPWTVPTKQSLALSSDSLTICCHRCCS